MKSVDRVFRIFLTVHLLAWTAVGLVRKSIAMDTAEAMIWGREWAFGTNKHPYLSGWVAELFRLGCGGDHHLAASLLAAVCTTLGMYFTYRLALRLTDRPRAVLSAMLLEGCVYFNVCGLEYNCNMLSIALMPLFFWAFHVALNGRLFHWLSVGVVAGLLLMTKYTNGVFLFTAAVYYIYLFIPHPSSPIPRPTSPVPHPSSLLFGAIVALVPFAVIVAPHIMFLVDTDFAVISYFIGRSATSSAWYDHILFPLRFFLAQVAACWLTIVLLVGVWISRKYPIFSRFTRFPPGGGLAIIAEDKLFLIISALCPVVLMTLISAVGAVQMKSMWGAALLGLIPLLSVSCVRFPLFNPTRLIWLSVVLALFVSVGQLMHTSFRSWADYEEISAIAKAEWNRKYGPGEIAFVGGHVSVAAPVALAMQEYPAVFQSMDPVRNQWLSESEIKRRGVLIVDDNPALIEQYCERFPRIRVCREVPFFAKAPMGRRKRRVLYIGFLPPDGRDY